MIREGPRGPYRAPPAGSSLRRPVGLDSSGKCSRPGCRGFPRTEPEGVWRLSSRKFRGPQRGGPQQGGFAFRFLTRLVGQDSRGVVVSGGS